MHYAASKGYKEIVSSLLEFGAENGTESFTQNKVRHNFQALVVSDIFQFERTPLDLAVSGGHNEVVYLLLEHMVKLANSEKTKDQDKKPTLKEQLTKILNRALHVAVSEGHKQVVALLLDSGADINAVKDTDTVKFGI